MNTVIKAMHIFPCIFSIFVNIGLLLCSLAELDRLDSNKLSVPQIIVNPLAPELFFLIL